MDKIQILLADDHALVRTGIAKLLGGHKDFLIVGEAADGQEALEKAQKLCPDVVIMDISMPKLSGIEATRMIRTNCPATKVLVLTMHENEEYVYQLMKAGAGGYILKSAGREEFRAAIRAVAAGEKFFSPRVFEILTEGYLQRAKERDEAPRRAESLLTKREREILDLLAQGLTNQEIANQLFISPRTVDTHRTNIMQKLDIHGAVNLVRFALEHGFGSPKK